LRIDHFFEKIVNSQKIAILNGQGSFVILGTCGKEIAISQELEQEVLGGL